MKTKITALCEMLKAKRNSLGLSQLEVAKKLGYGSAQFISNWKRGVASPPVTALKSLVKIYKLDEVDVFKLLLAAHEEDLRSVFYGRKRNA